MSRPAGSDTRGRCEPEWWRAVPTGRARPPGPRAPASRTQCNRHADSRGATHAAGVAHGPRPQGTPEANGTYRQHPLPSRAGPLVTSRESGRQGDPSYGAGAEPGGQATCVAPGVWLSQAACLWQLCPLRKQAFYQDALLWIRTCYYLFDFSCSSH